MRLIAEDMVVRLRVTVRMGRLLCEWKYFGGEWTQARLLIVVAYMSGVVYL